MGNQRGTAPLRCWWCGREGTRGFTGWFAGNVICEAHEACDRRARRREARIGRQYK